MATPQEDTTAAGTSAHSSAPPSLPSSSAPITTPHTINIGTRQSKLALIQTEIVISLLKQKWPQHTYNVCAISTMGDKNQITALNNFGDKGVWTFELEELLIGGQIDFIVHSCKDIPTHLPPSCNLGSILSRGDPRDALILHPKYFPPHPQAPPTLPTLSTLPKGSIVGTSSVRRSAQLKRLYPQLDFMSVRGNLGTRLSKLDQEDGPYAALILAAAGLQRLDLGHRINGLLESRNVEGDSSEAASKLGSDSDIAGKTSASDVHDKANDNGAAAQEMEYRQARKGDRKWGMLHAVCQGALGIEIRQGDTRVQELLAPIKDEKTWLACLAERSLLRTLEGGCSVPVGVETEWQDHANSDLTMRAIVVSVDGQEAAEAEMTKRTAIDEDADDFGREVALLLIQRGAKAILDKINLNRDVIEKQQGGA